MPLTDSSGDADVLSTSEIYRQMETIHTSFAITSLQRSGRSSQFGNNLHSFLSGDSQIVCFAKFRDAMYHMIDTKGK